MSRNNPKVDSSKISRSDNPRFNADPPAASAHLLQGQLETNETAQPSLEPGPEPDDGTETDPLRRAAYQFGWHSYLQYGRAASTAPTSFDALESSLRREWEQRQQASTEQHTWDAARDIVQDAWNKVHDAMSGED